MKQNLFLSYARSDDEPFVWRLYEELVKMGHAVWFDRVSMPNRGLTFLQAIRDAIDTCDRFLLVIGPAALTSDYVKAEWQHALVFAKTVIPVLRQGAVETLPDELKLPDILNFTEGKKAPSYHESVQKLQSQLAQPVLPVGPFLTTLPVLPLHFVQRNQVLESLDLLVKGDGIQPIVITGAKQAIALVGMGGLGKSVMAAALARSAKARRFFKDGIVWIEVGESGSLLDAARTLLHVFGQRDWSASWSQIRVQLPALIGNKTCLIVLDDLWSAGDMRTIQGSLGNSGRLMMTTRDIKLAEELDAPVVRQLDQMNEEEALQVLASWLEIEYTALPPVANEVARECGYLPLALTLCGAQVHEGLPWQEILQALREADPEVLSKVFVVMGTSLKMLQSTEPQKAELYTSLAVFPSDRPIPLAAVVTWWKANGLQSERQVYTTLLTLQGKALLSLNGKIPDAQITLHDLQFDYLRHITRGKIKDLHQAFVAAYHSVANGDWLQLPNDGYILEHFGYHLSEAEMTNVLEPLLFNVNWLFRKLSETSISELFKDIDRLENVPALADLRRALYQSAPAIGRDPTQLPGQLLGRLGTSKEPTLQALLKQCKQWRGAPWLQPVLPSLLSPNAALSMILTGHEGTVRSVAFSHDGRILASAGNSAPDQTIRIWDLYSGAEKHVLADQAIAGGYTPMAFTFESHELLVAYGNELRVWDWQKGRMKRSLTKHNAQVQSMIPAPDTNRLLTTDGEVALLWDTDTWKILYTHPTSEGLLGISLSPRGDRIASAYENQITIVDWETNKTLQINLPIKHSCDLWFSETGEDVLWRTGDGRLQCLNVERKINKVIMETGLTDLYVSLDVRSGLLLTKPDNYNQLPVLYHYKSAKQLGSLQISSKDDAQDRVPSCVAISPGGELVVMCDYQHRIEIWNTGKLRERREDEMQQAAAFRFTDDSQQLWVKSDDEDSGVFLAVSDGTKSTNKALSAKIRKQIYTELENGSVDLEEEYNAGWKLLTKNRNAQLYASRSHGKGAEFEEPDVLKTGYTGHVVRFVGSKEGEILLEGHTLRVNAGILFKNNSRAATAGYGRVIRVWNLASGDTEYLLRGHTDIIYGLAASNDGRRLMSCGNDRTAMVWDMDDGSLIATYTADQPLYRAAISPDGKAFAVAKAPLGRLHLLRLHL